MTNRRKFLKSAAAFVPSTLIAAQTSAAEGAATVSAKLRPNSISVSTLPSHFDVEPNIHNLENGYWGIMPRSVAKVYAEQTAYVNRTNSIWARYYLEKPALPQEDARYAKR